MAILGAALNIQTLGRVTPCVYGTAVNSAVTITLPARSGERHHLLQVWWSYSATPTGGRISTTGLEGDEFDADITAGGVGPPMFPPAVGANSTEVTVTLAAGGSGVTGKLGAFYLTLPG